jgi:pyridoxamine 5'-phosphate oxidase
MNPYQEALQRFGALFNQAETCGLTYPQAMSLATADAAGRPAMRTVLLKGFDEDGFVFYTNQTSRKGQELAQNPYAALLFYWQALAQQVSIEGTVTIISSEEADAYWRTRPLESRIGAWASQQSQVLDSRATLELRYQEFAAKFGEDVPRPPHWSGYRLVPQRIEFWEERPFRLHERVCYFQQNDIWLKKLLNP